METDNASDCGFDRETHIAHVRYLTHVAVGCYAVAALLGIAGTITAFLTSELQPLFAYLPAGLLAYIGEKYIERMHTEIVERIGEDGAAQVGVPLPILPMLHDWFFKRTEQHQREHRPRVVLPFLFTLPLSRYCTPGGQFPIPRFSVR